MTITKYTEHLAEWSKGKSFSSMEDMMVAIQDETRNVLTEGTIVRLATYSGWNGKGYRFIVGDGGPFCYIYVHTTGKKKLTIEKVTGKKVDW